MDDRGQLRLGTVDAVELGTAELMPDPARPQGWILLVDGVAQSYVDLEDPTYLEFSYVRQVAAVIDSIAARGAPLRVLHLGGGGMTLARYIVATRPGSQQQVIERDAALAALVCRRLPLPESSGVSIQLGEARTAVLDSPDAEFDLVISDVYRGGQMSLTVATAQFAAQVARVLRPGGLCVVNVTDEPPLAFSRVQAATLRSAFADVGVFTEPRMLRGRRFGNLVLVAACWAGGLPTQRLATVAATNPRMGRFLHGAQVDEFIAGAQPLREPDRLAAN